MLTKLALPALALSMLLPQLTMAEIKVETVEYKDGGTVCEGAVAYDDASKTPCPGVLLVPDWMGVGDYAKSRAKQVAALGYVCFVADIYGKGVRPANADEAGALAGKYKGDRPLLRQRANAAFAELKKNPLVQKAKTAAMGYCFGGTTVLELARSGAEVPGVVTFHGGLDSPNPADGKNIKGKVLVLHGADDPFVKPADIAAFQEELRSNKVDWQMVYYGDAVHSFTRPDAGTDKSKGAAYQEAADKRSWEAMKEFYQELFGPAGKP
jgi:dienelactone hydrolase